MSIADKLKTIAENSPKVYNAGKKSQYDEFWDCFQENGTRKNYQYAFGQGWDDKIFKPKYSITLVAGYTGSNMFFANRVSDIAKALEDCGVVLDTSKGGDLYQMFVNYQGKRVPRIDCSASMQYSRGIQYMFSNAINLETIDALVLKEETKLDNAFNNCHELKNLTIEGTIGQNGFNVQSSTKLSKASIISIINALSSSSTTSGLTVTLSKTAVNNAFETESGKADGSTSQEWHALAATKSNWTISLA